MLGVDMSEHGVEVGRLRPRGIIEHSIEALRDAAESQPHRVRGDTGVDHRAHHSHTLMIQGQSYRVKQERKAGLLGTAPPPSRRAAASGSR